MNEIFKEVLCRAKKRVVLGGQINFKDLGLRHFFEGLLNCPLTDDETKNHISELSSQVNNSNC